MTVPLDTPGELSLRTEVTPAGDVVYGRDGGLFLVRLNGLEAEPSVLLLDGEGVTPSFEVDPNGRFVFARTPELGLQWISLVDLHVFPMDAFPGGATQTPLLSPDGESGFAIWQTERGSQLAHVLLDEDDGEPILVSPMVSAEGISSVDPYGLRPAAATGLIVERDSTLEYLGVANELPLSPVPLHGPGVEPQLPLGTGAWSPDGRRFLFETQGQTETQAWLADFALGHLPVLHTLGSHRATTGRRHQYRWTPDGAGLIVARHLPTSDAWTLELVHLDGGSPIAREAIAGPYAEISLGDLRRDSSALVFTAALPRSEYSEVYFLELMPQSRPTVLSAPLQPGEFATSPTFSPEADIVAYALRGRSGPSQTRLALVEVANPGVAVIAADGLAGPDWLFIEVHESRG